MKLGIASTAFVASVCLLPIVAVSGDDKETFSRAGNFTNCQPSQYYAVFGSTPIANVARSEMRSLIKNTHEHVLPYTSSKEPDVWDALIDVDGFVNNGTRYVKRIYAAPNTLTPAYPYDQGSCQYWNREHLWPKSLGVGDGGADYTDIHHMRPADCKVNAARGNLLFGECGVGAPASKCIVPGHANAANDTAKDTVSFLPPTHRRGDIARAIFYMELRYDGDEQGTVDLMLSDCANGVPNQMGYLSQLLKWNLEDPPDDEEIARNGKVCSDWQGNRNPFVDYPQLATRYFGTNNTHLGDGLGYNCTAARETLPPAAAPLTLEPSVITLISAIQGSTGTSPMLNATVTVSALVVGDFQNGDADEARNMGGFFLQEEDSDSDNDIMTSEGIFIYEGAGNTTKDVKLGDLVKVTGRVGQFQGQNQITASSFTIESSNNTLPSQARIVFPKSALELRAYEGMHVVINDTMTITDMYNLGRYGEIKLISKDRMYSFTQVNAPGNATGYAAHVNDINQHSITYENGLFTQNVDVSLLDGFGPEYSTATAPRMGDQMKRLAGILQYSSNKWKIRSTFNGQNTVDKVNERPLMPPDVLNGFEGGVKIVSLNVLNMFNTIAKDNATAGPPPGMEPRGAKSDEEYGRQLDKLSTMIALLDADLLGLLELENDFGAAKGDNCTLKTVVDLVNVKVAGEGTYDYVWPGQRYVDTTDAISVGIIYKRNVFSMVGNPAILTDSNLPAGAPPKPIFEGMNTNRASMAASFTHLNECVTVAANHFKSKSGTGTGEGNRDMKDGAGSWNKRRLDAATAVTMWMDTEPTGYNCSNKILLGDLNAYAMEDPITYIQNAGYVNVEGKDAYSFVFDGQKGTLDYVFVNQKLNTKVLKAAVWHVNEDEATVLDYGLEFGRNRTYFDGSSPVRSSDHSPVLLGLDLSGTAVPTARPTFGRLPATPKPVAAKSTKKPVAAKVAKLFD